MKYGNLTYKEISKYAADGAIAVVPTGCTEQQGPHLTVDFDTWFAESISVAAADALSHDGIEVVVLPAIPFGPTPEHRDFGSGFIDLPQEIHEALISAILHSLDDQGFYRVVIWRGCGQHDLSKVVDSFNSKDSNTSVRVFQPELPYHDVWCKVGDPTVPGGHADSFTTSIALYLRPQTVRPNLIANPQSEPVDWDDPDLSFAKYTKSGVIGDPTLASIELGEQLWIESVACVFRIFQSISRKD